MLQWLKFLLETCSNTRTSRAQHSPAAACSGVWVPGPAGVRRARGRRRASGLPAPEEGAEDLRLAPTFAAGPLTGFVQLLLSLLMLFCKLV